MGLSAETAPLSGSRLPVTLFGGPKLAGYLHPGSHSRLLVQAEGGSRLRLGRFELESILGLGVTRMFRASPTYTLSDGELERVPLAGQWGVMPSVAAGFGGGLSESLRWFVRPTLLLQVPYNSAAAPFFVMEIGARRSR